MGLTVGRKDYFDKTGKKAAFSLRLDESVYDMVKRVAEIEKRSINKQLEALIENALIEYLEEHQD